MLISWFRKFSAAVAVVVGRDPLTTAVVISSILALAKLAVFFASGSMIVLASSLDSITDALVSAVNRKASKYARTVADQEHPYGHGGYEIISTLIQGMVMTVAALLIGWESVTRLFTQKSTLDLDNMPVATAVMLVAVLSGWLIQRVLQHGEENLSKGGYRSLSLTADRAHYLADAWINACGLGGLILVWWTGWTMLDAVMGTIAAGLLLKAAFPVLRSAFLDIVSHEAPSDIQRQITEIARGADKRILGTHRLRTRLSGPNLFADFHLKMPDEISLKEAHDISEQVVASIRDRFPACDVIVHLDPASEPDDDL